MTNSKQTSDFNQVDYWANKAHSLLEEKNALVNDKKILMNYLKHISEKEGTGTGLFAGDLQKEIKGFLKGFKS